MKIDESFDIQEVKEPRISPKETRNTIIQSFLEAGFTNQEIAKIITKQLKGLGYSYKFQYKNKEFLLYEIIKDSIKEYHFFDLNEPLKSAEDVGDLDNSILIFSKIFNLMYTDLKKGNWKLGVRIKSNPKRNKLYKKIFNKVNKKHNLGLLIKDKTSDSFVVDIPRPKSFRESMRLD